MTLTGSLVLAIAVAGSTPQAASLGPQAAARRAPQASSRHDRSLGDLPGVARVFRDIMTSAPAGDTPAARLSDFEQVLVAVTGRPESTGHTADEYGAAFRGSSPFTVPVDPSTLGRDEACYRLHSLGYSPREIADILAGRITKAALDTAQKMLMVGTPREQVSDYLDGEYRRTAEARERARRQPLAAGPAIAEAHVARYAGVHGINPALARAVIACESGWNQQARSRAGAIGLMQLMPGTARELGVDPYDLEQNIEGGLRYLAWLLRTFGTVEQSLVAYNAGPTFARRFTRGEVALYGETRDFVRRVTAMLR